MTTFENDQEREDFLAWVEAGKPRGPAPQTTEKLRSALQAAVDTIQDYLAYAPDTDPWVEDSRAMGEMDINHYGLDGRLDYALSVLSETSSKPSEGSAIDALMIGSYVNEAAHNVLLKHTVSEGGFPRINWYKLRDEIAAAMEEAIDSFRSRVALSSDTMK